MGVKLYVNWVVYFCEFTPWLLPTTISSVHRPVKVMVYFKYLGINLNHYTDMFYYTEVTALLRFDLLNESNRKWWSWATLQEPSAEVSVCLINIQHILTYSV